jgi:hypothetical protein
MPTCAATTAASNPRGANTHALCAALAWHLSHDAASVHLLSGCGICTVRFQCSVASQLLLFLLSCCCCCRQQVLQDDTPAVAAPKREIILPGGCNIYGVTQLGPCKAYANTVALAAVFVG